VAAARGGPGDHRYRLHAGLYHLLFYGLPASSSAAGFPLAAPLIATLRVTSAVGSQPAGARDSRPRIGDGRLTCHCRRDGPHRPTYRIAQDRPGRAASSKMLSGLCPDWLADQE